MRLAHLVGRFFGTLVPWGPSEEQARWVGAFLTPEEFALWSKMARYDRTHSIRVARAVERSANILAVRGRDYGRAWVGVALLHDIGKIEAHLGRLGRVLATCSGWIINPATQDSWSGAGGLRARLAAYLAHGEIGAEMIMAVGGGSAAAEWSRAHHRPNSWPALGFPAEVVGLLASCDGDRSGARLVSARSAVSS